MTTSKGRVRCLPQPVAMAAAVVALAAGALGVYLASPSARMRDPIVGLQQLDLFYLDQPAPLADRLNLARGRPTVLVICDDCRRPGLDAAVRMTDRPEVARAYGLLTASGRVGPGYAIVDGSRRLRYRTFDTEPAAHRDEIAVLVQALS